jgi:OOP family OmpA-OmpF porin
VKSRIGLLVFAMVFVWCGSASAQFGGLKSLGKKALEKAESKSDEQPSESQPAEKNDSNENNSSSSSSNSAAPATNSKSATASQAPGGQPNLVSVPIDFIPGEKTVFFDDFTDMPPGEPPPHWQVRGGHVDLMMGGGVRALNIPEGVNLTSGSLKVPKDFTFQVVLMPNLDSDNGSGFLNFSFRDKDDNEVIGGEINVKYGSVSLSNDLGSAEAKWDPSKPNEYDFWAQQGRVRAYVNGNRLIDVNQVQIGPIDHLYLEEAQGTFQLRSVRIAESAPDPGSVLMTTGKLVTHGIYFDTDSDVLKPESAPVIKAISTALYKNMSMKVEIDGYTDSTGDAAHNLDLSKRRAAAVMKVLVAQFGIDQSRLTSNGFGAANPIASNDTPDGRAQNRRVEFVKK